MIHFIFARGLSLSCNQKLGPRSHSAQTEVGGEAVNPCKATVGFISCSLEANNYFIVMNACTTAYHMTIIQTVNTSDAIGEYFNVSKK